MKAEGEGERHSCHTADQAVGGGIGELPAISLLLSFFRLNMKFAQTDGKFVAVNKLSPLG